MPVIAPFTEEELRSMRGYDRRCGGMTDHHLDLDELYLTIRCMARRGVIRYRPDAREKIRAMGLKLSELSRLCGLYDGSIAHYSKQARVPPMHVRATRASPLNTSFSGRRGEASEYFPRTA